MAGRDPGGSACLIFGQLFPFQTFQFFGGISVLGIGGRLFYANANFASSFIFVPHSEQNIFLPPFWDSPIVSRKFCIFETIIAYCLLFCLHIFQEFSRGAAGRNVPGPGHPKGAEVAFPEGRAQTAKGAPEQGRADFLLKASDCLAYGRLGVIQFLGGFGNAAGFADL